METKIITLPEKRIVCVENVGGLLGAHKRFGRNSIRYLGERITCTSMAGEWDVGFSGSRWVILVEEKRSYAAMTVDKDFVNKYGLKEVITLGGIYAIAVHFGDTEGMGPVWGQMYDGMASSHSGWGGRDCSRPNLEWYQNRVQDPELTLTFMCTPVKKDRKLIIMLYNNKEKGMRRWNGMKYSHQLDNRQRMKSPDILAVRRELWYIINEIYGFSAYGAKT